MNEIECERLGHTVANVVALLTFIGTWIYGAVVFGITGASIAWIAAGIIGVAVGVAIYYLWMALVPAFAGMTLSPVLSRRQ